MPLTRSAIRNGLAALDRLVTADRVRAWAIVLCLGYLAGIAWLIVTLRHGLDPRGRPLGADFIAFYSASRMTLAGKAALAYSAQPLLDLQKVLAPGIRGACPWYYPPTLQLLVWPLGLLRYEAALAVWSAIGVVAYLLMIRGFSSDRRALFLALAFPGVYMNIAQGQTGLIVAALFGGGLLLLDRRPLLGGLMLGLLVIKPQYGVLIPLLLAVSGRWRGFVAATASCVGLSLVATLLFGGGIWLEFLRAGPNDAAALGAGALPIFKDPSIFGYLTWLGVATPIAVVVHLASAVMAAGLAVAVWRRPVALELKAGVAVLATLIVLPFEFDYDLALLAIPIAVGLKRLDGGRPGARCALVLMALAPILIAPVTRFLYLPVGPVVLWSGLAVLLMMSGRETAFHPARNAATLTS